MDGPRCETLCLTPATTSTCTASREGNRRSQRLFEQRARVAAPTRSHDAVDPHEVRRRSQIREALEQPLSSRVVDADDLASERRVRAPTVGRRYVAGEREQRRAATARSDHVLTEVLPASCRHSRRRRAPRDLRRSQRRAPTDRDVHDARAHSRERRLRLAPRGRRHRRVRARRARTSECA